MTGVGWEPTLVSLKNFCEVTFHEHRSYSGHLPSFWLPNNSIPLFYDGELLHSESLWGWAGFVSYYRSRKRPASLSPCPLAEVSKVRHGTSVGLDMGVANQCWVVALPRIQGPWAVSEQDSVSSNHYFQPSPNHPVNTVQYSFIISFFWWSQPQSIPIVGCKDHSLDLPQDKEATLSNANAWWDLAYQYVSLS